ncbi:MAG: AAA family ATPase [Bacteroidales bacterium]|nr:AAA family ATPase [Bacteroidales bacterium]
MFVNKQLELAYRFVQETGKHIFLTGKAGTGKTTFLKNLKQNISKRLIVTAPTGVAAINAGGVTLHSFFQLPFSPYIPGHPSNIVHRRFGKEKINLIRSLDLLVIDEISMVRADILDAVDDVLRYCRRNGKPFGGVQLLLIGDLQQLAPVVKEEEWHILNEHYISPYFFYSKAFAATQYVCIELEHIYRQSDPDFIYVLNKIRENKPDDLTLNLLDKCYRSFLSLKEKEGYITLCTHNRQASVINDSHMGSLPGEPYLFRAEIKDDFPEYLYPTEIELELKEGAQVMFVRNDSSPEKRFFNGKIGRIVHLSSEKVEVLCENEFAPIVVERAEWDNTKYVVDDVTKEITQTVIGSFSQIPLKPAWAITVHKSQGLTFDKVIIDINAAFAHGQVYVALSRCRTLEGLVLTSPFKKAAVISDLTLQEFSQKIQCASDLELEFTAATRLYYKEQLTELFDFSEMQRILYSLQRSLDDHFSQLYPAQYALWIKAILLFRNEIIEISSRFCRQLAQMVDAYDGYAENPVLKERIEKGGIYFMEKIEAIEKDLPLLSVFSSDNKIVVKAMKEISERYYKELYLKKSVLPLVHEGFNLLSYLDVKAKVLFDEKLNKLHREKVLKQETPTDILHPELYDALRLWRKQQAEKLKLPAYTVLQQKAIIGISDFLPVTSKELLQIKGVGTKVVESYGEKLLEMVRTYRLEKGIDKNLNFE